MPSTLPGPLVVGFFDKLKQEHGLSYAKIAEMCGLKRQNVTDLRNGRRRFSREMADRLLAAQPDEPWGAWLEPLLNYYFCQPEPERAEKAMASLGLPPPDVIPHPGVGRLPLLNAPVLGDPEAAAAFSGEYVQISRPLLSLVDQAYQPYILKVPYDDFALRLRAGDFVLVQQTLEFEREIMLVREEGRLSLARSHSHAQKLRLAEKLHDMEETLQRLETLGPPKPVNLENRTTPLDSLRQSGEKIKWLSLETGKPLKNAEPVACVACIAMAML